MGKGKGIYGHIRINIHLSPGLHSRLRVWTVLRGVTIQEAVEQLIDSATAKDKRCDPYTPLGMEGEADRFAPPPPRQAVAKRGMTSQEQLAAEIMAAMRPRPAEKPMESEPPTIAQPDIALADIESDPLDSDQLERDPALDEEFEWPDEPKIDDTTRPGPMPDDRDERAAFEAYNNALVDDGWDPISIEEYRAELAAAMGRQTSTNG